MYTSRQTRSSSWSVIWTRMDELQAISILVNPTILGNWIEMLGSSSILVRKRT